MSLWAGAVTGADGRSHEFRVVAVGDRGVPVARLTSCGCGWFGGCSDMSRLGFTLSRSQWVRHLAEQNRAELGGGR